jgi:hypothetical protein
MVMQSLVDWWRLVRSGGSDLGTIAQIYPAPMSAEQMAALDTKRVVEARGGADDASGSDLDRPLR